jgi:ribonuclease D
VFGYGQEELARRLDRSVNWVVAMKYLVPVARVNLEDRARTEAAFVQPHCNTRQAGQLYAAWREGLARGPRAHLGRAGTDLENAAAVIIQAAGRAGLERDLEMAVAILRRTRRRQTAALQEMDGPRPEQAQHQIESGFPR